MDAFGWFTEDRFGYDRNYGIVDQDWHRFADKYNIWQKSHVDGTQCAVDAVARRERQRPELPGRQRRQLRPRHEDGPAHPRPARPAVHARAPSGRTSTATRTATGRRTSASSRTPTGIVVNPGSRCDEFKNKCDIPLYDRTTKTTPLYYGPTLGAGPLRHDRAGAQLVEHRGQARGAARQGGRGEPRQGRRRPDVARLPDERGRPARRPDDGHKTVPDIFVLCHNPVIAGDSARLRRRRASTVRLGDLRYNVVNIIQIPSTRRPGAS